MNLNEIKLSQKKLKELSPEAYNDSVDISIPFFILHKKIYEEGNSILINKYNLSQTELDILGVLFYLAGDDFTMSPTQLYEKLLFSSGGMTKVLKKLESKSFIQRVDNPNDKRSKLVQITKEGKETTSLALKEILEHENKCFSKLEEEERKLLRKLLLKALF